MEVMETQDTEYSSKALDAMYKAWKDNLYCDITLKCGTKSIRAHKIVLMALSEYFRNFFKYSTNSHDINAEDLELDSSIFKETCIEHLLNFAYTGKILIEGECVQELVVMASFLQIEFIQQECEKFMAKNLDISNVLPLLAFSNQFNLTHLYNSGVTFASNNFIEIRDKGLFWELPTADFKMLLSNSKFNALQCKVPVENPELELLRLVGKYLSIISVSSEDFNERTVTDLLKEIRFQEILSAEDIHSTSVLYPVLNCLELFDALENRDKCKNDSQEVRMFSNSMKKIVKGRAFANGGQENQVLESFEDSWKDGKDLNDRPNKFTLWIRRWDGRPILAGISIQYKSGKLVSYGGKPRDKALFVSEHVFSLQENEVITSITVRSGFMIDSLKFVSNLGREFGPFGGSGGSERTESLITQPSYLHSLSGKVVLAQGQLAITCLQFNWISFCEVETLEKDGSQEYLCGLAMESDYDSNDSDFL